FSVNQMIAKESVRARMEDREVGISYTEFSYMLLQAFDFYVLARDHGCELQIGGSDQWGNITAGIDLMRKKLGKQGFGLTLPLITKADGTKFGKTEGGSVWLDPQKTSVYKFYQFWINSADADVIRYLKFFTFLPKEEIESLEKKHVENPGAREAHKALAASVTSLIHGETELKFAIRASDILFGGNLEGIDERTFEEVFAMPTDMYQGVIKDAFELVGKELGGVPRKFIEKSKLDGAGVPLVEMLIHAGLCPSKGQARKDIEGGGVNINNVRETSATRAVTSNDLLFGKHILLRKGKKNYVVVTAR
ncbi:MAG TPA: tyrosine--tRNA ligase, partial [Candidatus Binatia bacterium]|nr:tyrosine--tRNA ligase [Candidatus Binatia bacterium]